ncbi:4446_t:CDS:2, partial [Ambispora gerdemannii]
MLSSTPLIPKYNQSLIELLEIIEKARDLDGKSSNPLSYRHAIAALKAYPREIKSETEARQIKGTIEEAENLLNSERFLVLSTFSQVYGVGYKPLKYGIARVIGPLMMPVKILISLKLNESDWNSLNSFKKSPVDPKCTLTPVGGYRRGKEFNGDVDVIVTHPVEEAATQLLPRIIDKLSQKGYLKYKMWHGHTVPRHKMYGRTVPKHNILDKCICAFYHPSAKLHRQVDIIIAPHSLYPTAVVGWTGSRQFERSFKLYAS